MHIHQKKINTFLAAGWTTGLCLATFMCLRKSVTWLTLSVLILVLIGGISILQDHSHLAKGLHGERVKWQRRDSQWLALTAALPMAYMVKMAMSGTNHVMLNNVLHLLFVWPVFWAIRRTGMDLRWMLWGASTGAIAAAVLTASQVWSGVERVELRAIPNPIPLGNFSLLLGAIGGLAWLFRHELRVHRCQLEWAALGVVAGIWVSVVSGSRGGWLAVPIMGWVYSLAWPQWRWQHRWGLVLCVLLLVAVTALTVPMMQHRLLIGWQDISRYWNHINHWQGSETLGSMDRRLEMWRLGALAFVQAPWLGLGFTGFDEFLHTYIQNGWTHPEVMMHGETGRHQHLHNEIVTTAARLGVIGLCALAWLWLDGLRWLKQGMNLQASIGRAHGLAGLLTHSAVIIFALTDSMFGMTINTMIYAVLLGMSAGGLRHAELGGGAAGPLTVAEGAGK